VLAGYTEFSFSWHEVNRLRIHPGTNLTGFQYD
jgi:hypothetical protein